MPKGRARRRRRRKSELFYEKLLQRELWTPLLSSAHWKLYATALLALFVLPLGGIFAYRGDTNALYVLILSSASLGFMIWALPNLKLGLTAIFLFTQPLLIYLGNTEYGYTKAIYSLGFISLLMIVWVVEMALHGRARLQLTPLSWPGLLILITALLSLINSQTLLGDLQYIVLLIYFGVFYLWLANILSQPQEIRFLLGALLLSAAAAALYGLLQYFGVLPGAPGASGRSWSMISTFGNQNYLGGFLAYLIVPGLTLLFWARSATIKAFALISLGVLVVTLMAIDSDAAWLAVMISLGIWLLLLWIRRGLEPLRIRWRWSVALVATVASLTLGLLLTTVLWVQGAAVSLSTIRAVVAPFSPLAWAGLAMMIFVPVIPWLDKLFRSREKRWGWLGMAAAGLALLIGALTPVGQDLVQTLYQQALRSSAQIRAWDWWVGYEMFKDHPMVGIGLGDYKREFLPYKAEFLTTERGQYYARTVGYIVRAAQAHNEYVQILAEMGILGVLATAFLILMLIKSTFSRLRSVPSSEGLGTILALFAGIVAFMSDSLFSFPLHLPANALVLICLLGALQSRAFGEGGPMMALSPRTVRILASVVVLVALGVSVFAYRDWRADFYLDLGERFLKTGNTEGAKQALEKSLSLDFAPAEVLYWLGSLYLAEGDLQKSREFFERSLPHLTTENSYYQLAWINLELARVEKMNDAELARRHLEEARRYLEVLLAIDPEPSLKPNILYFKARALWQEGRLEDALSLLEDLRQDYPDGENIFVALAQIYLQQELTQKARENFEQALQIINRKLADLQRRLVPGAQVPLDDYYRWRSDQENLESLKSRVEEALRRLGR